jgi:hypothetical protein
LVVGIGLLTQPAAAALIGWLAYGERLGATDFAGRRPDLPGAGADPPPRPACIGAKRITCCGS